MDRGMDGYDASLDNQIATYLMINPWHSFAPPKFIYLILEKKKILLIIDLYAHIQVSETSRNGTSSQTSNNYSLFSLQVTVMCKDRKPLMEQAIEAIWMS